MKSIKRPAILLLSALGLFLTMVLMGTVPSNVENPDLARVEFFVG